nr:efflux RND transporter periplasmic adaptor subunit [candidate division Zixibacteria bacterium]
MNTMKSRRLTYIKAALIILLMAGCSGKKDTESAVDVEKAVSIKGQIVVATDAVLNRVFTGTIEGEKQAVLTAKISEAVEAITAREGELVKADDIIIRLDRSGPTSNYIQTQSVFQNAEKNYFKMKNLYEAGAVSESAYDGALTEYEVAKANFEAARQTVEIKTPIAGMVTSVDISAGDYLYPGQTVATVASMDRLRMKLGVSATDIGLFRVGEKVAVFVESADLLAAEARIARVARSADPATRTFAVEIEIDNSARTLKPGMFGRARIAAVQMNDVIAIPRSAVIATGNADRVFVVNGDRVAARDVELGVDFDGTVEIKSGLNPGDTLVTVGQNYLEDGKLIKLVRYVNERGEEITL